jgi:Condensation domain
VGIPAQRAPVLRRRVEPLTPEKQALLREVLRRRAAETTIPRRIGGGSAPLSFSQHRMWFLDQLEPGAPTQNGARAVRFAGELDVEALERALHAVVQRHESLRTVFIAERGEPRQVALDDWSLELPVVDLQQVSGEDRDRELHERLRNESRRGFDLASELMVRPTLYRLGPTEHVLLLAMHHIAFDASSDRVLNRELAELYDAFRTNRTPELAKLPIQYADYAVWQRARLQGSVLDELVSYWQRTLDDAPERLRLPTDRSRPAVQQHRGRHRYFSFDGRFGAAIAELARSEGATSYMTMLAAFNTLLYRFAGDDDIVIGSPVAGRSHVELEGLIGFFTNTLVLRNRLNGNPTFRELIRRVRESTAGALAHQELPFEKLVECLRIRHDPSFNPLFQVNFRAHAEPRRLLELPGLSTVGAVPIDIGFSRFDLALELQVDTDVVSGYFEYDEQLFDTATIDGLTADLEELLGRIVEAPETRVLALLPRRTARPQDRRPIPRSAR